MNREHARQLAGDALQRRAASIRCPLVLLEPTEERPSGWVFSYEAARYVEHGRREDRLLGNGPIYVHKETGVVTFLGTYAPRERVIDDHERDFR